MIRANRFARIALRIARATKRLKISIPEGDLEIFQGLGPLGRPLACGATGPFCGGVAVTPPATHWKQQNEPRQGCSYTLERDRRGGGVQRLRHLESPQEVSEYVPGYGSKR